MCSQKHVNFFVNNFNEKGTGLVSNISFSSYPIGNPGIILLNCFDVRIKYRSKTRRSPNNVVQSRGSKLLGRGDRCGGGI